MFMRLFMGKQQPNPLECAGTYQESKKKNDVVEGSCQ